MSIIFDVYCVQIKLTTLAIDKYSFCMVADFHSKHRVKDNEKIIALFIFFSSF